MFRKVATVESLGLITDSGIQKFASANAQSSHYLSDGATKLDFSALLKRYASAYKISSDPRDFAFEAILANTTGVPNQNADAFPKIELLSTNFKVGKVVYRTYEGKPHHVDHKSSDPTKAMGIIIDAHYNHSAACTPNCPGCGLDVRADAARSSDGIYCAACLTPVKNEYVEILLGIDTTKDPAYWQSVKLGHANKGSMGCLCERTVCNVCGNIAKSAKEFCEHVASPGKGALWLKSAKSNGWEKISAHEAQQLASAGNLTFNPQQFSNLVSVADGWRIARGFEHCHAVEFEEYSRVGNPADPRAISQGLLVQAAQVPEDQMKNKLFIVRPQGNALQQFAGRTLDEAITKSGGAQNLEFCELEINAPLTEEVLGRYAGLWNAASARAVVAQAEAPGMTAPGGQPPPSDAVNIQAPPGKAVVVQPAVQNDQNSPDLDPVAPNAMPPNPPGPPGAQPQGQPGDLEAPDMPPGSMMPGAQPQSPAPRSAYKQAYKDWVIDIREPSKEGESLICTPEGVPVLKFTARLKPNCSVEDRAVVARKIAASLFSVGLTATSFRLQAQAYDPAEQAMPKGVAQDDFEHPYDDDLGLKPSSSFTESEPEYANEMPKREKSKRIVDNSVKNESVADSTMDGEAAPKSVLASQVETALVTLKRQAELQQKMAVDGALAANQRRFILAVNRLAVGAEESKFKKHIIAALTTPRVLDDATETWFDGLEPSHAARIAAELFDTKLEILAQELLEKAASYESYSDDFLASAEADVMKLVANYPAVEPQSSYSEDDYSARARSAAIHGNQPALAGAVVSNEQTQGSSVQTQIRSALAGVGAGQQLQQLLGRV